MADRLRNIPALVLEWWNKFTSRQKTIIVSITAGVLVAFAILITLISRPQYELLLVCENTKESAQIISLLEEASPSISYKVSEDGYQISVLKSQVSQANLLLGANDIPTVSMSISDVTSGGMSTTEADKQKLYVEFKQSQMEADLKSMESIITANVRINIPKNDGTLIREMEDSSAAIMLELADDFSDENAVSVAQYVKTALGNDNIQKITIIDKKGNLLFSGEENFTTSGMASTQLTLKQKTEAAMQSNIRKVLLGTNEFNMVEVSSNLVLDFSSQQITDHAYTPADGQTQGLISHQDTYEAENTGGVSGIPGTDSNNEDVPDYVLADGANGSSSVAEQSTDYVPNEKITYTEIPAGLVKYGESSLAVAAIKYRVLKQEDAKNQGLLDGISWEEYKAQNSERTKLEVDEDLVNMVAMASGIALENISMVAYEEPLYIDAEGMNIQVADIAQIVLIVLILALLVFVILRSMRTEKAEEVEEEVSVEDLLQSTPEATLDDIELETKSETRKMIEKFVDDNPEAAANLLRNWLNDDWG